MKSECVALVGRSVSLFSLEEKRSPGALERCRWLVGWRDWLWIIDEGIADCRWDSRCPSSGLLIAAKWLLTATKQMHCQTDCMKGQS